MQCEKRVMVKSVKLSVLLSPTHAKPHSQIHALTQAHAQTLTCTHKHITPVQKGLFQTHIPY